MPATRDLHVTALVAVLTLILPWAAMAAGSPGGNLAREAKKEGSVTIYAAGHTLSQVQLLAKSFEKKYGIPVNYVRKSAGQISTMIQSERSAGQVSADVVSINNQDLMVDWQKQGIIVRHTVPNAAAILSTQRPPSGAAYVPFDWLALGIAYNTGTIKGRAIPRTWQGFLDEANGKTIVVANPKSSGVVPTFMTVIDKFVSGRFYEELAKSGAKFYKTSNSLEPVQLLATGEADFAIPGVETAMFQAERAGEPVGMSYPEKHVPIVTGWIAVMAHAPHPNAGRLLVDYQLSKAFQTLQLETGSRSVLEGVPNPKGLPSLSPHQVVRVSSKDVRADMDTIVTAYDRLH